MRQFELVRNKVAANREPREHRYAKRIHDNVTNGETQLRLGRTGTREPHSRLLFAHDVGTQQFFVAAKTRPVVAIRPVQLLR